MYLGCVVKFYQKSFTFKFRDINFRVRLEKCLALFFLIIGPIIHAQKPSVPAIDEFVNSIYDSISYIPSISIGVVQNGKIVHQQAYGYRDISNKSLAETSTQYYIASTTKSFTALAATILEEKGMLDFQKPLAAYFPKINFPDSIQADKITIPDLLGHTSGIDNCADMTFKLAYSGSYTYDDLFAILTETCSRGDYGAYRYSNFGYNLLNLIFIKELGKTWKQVVQEEILNPFGMDKTFSSYTELLESREHIATPYRALGINGKDFFQIPDNIKRDDTMHAAGGLYSSVDDILKWLLLQVNNGEINGKIAIPLKLLSKTRELRGEIEPDRFGLGKYNMSYGLGWNIAKFKDKMLYHHGGAFTGYSTLISFMPENKAGVVVMVNDNQIGNGLSSLITQFIYDLMDQNIEQDNPDWKNSYAVSVSNIKVESKEYGLDRMYQDYSNRMKRTWDFSVPYKVITGAYICQDGNRPMIRIFEIEGKLGVIQGNMNASVEPYIYPNTIRVDMFGIGDMLKLEVDGNRVIGFTYKDNYFAKL